MDVALIPSASSPFVECALVTVDERVVVDGEPPRTMLHRGPSCS